MSISLKIERISGGVPIEFGDGKITGFSYMNKSPIDFLAKANNAVHSVQIRGEIPLRLLPPITQNSDNTNTLYVWALTEYRPDNDFYRTCTIQVVRHEKTIREVVFTHAYVHAYTEQVNGMKGVLEFELVIRQKRDQLDSIRLGPHFGSVEKKKQQRVTILESAQETYKGSRTSHLYAYAGNSAAIGQSYMPSIDEIDASLKSALSKQQKIDLAKLQEKFRNAQAAEDTEGMQQAHDAANAIRLYILNSVVRTNFADGSSTIIFRQKLMMSNGEIVQPYLKFEAGASLLVGATLEAKAQDGKFTLAFKTTVGNIGASMSASGGVEFVGSDGKKGASAGVKIGSLGFVEANAGVLFDKPGVKASIGGGIGVGTEVRLPLQTIISTKLENDFTIIEIDLLSDGNGPRTPTVQQWNSMLEGRGWYGVKLP
ncbi:hypothetical protein [Paenibacillus elgii]|uniref:hypothetical protein n=1 Tax=Paenibacillus elgii TaxID=189691 RepID=UPI00203E88CC|nr:hypothetical protein [Paenibacillus elgii]MCM3269093.1 hypothetical protein [Paenibacillus elgii]